MGTIELKQYWVTAGSWVQFLSVWRQIVAVRQRHGFIVLFALADRLNNRFTWAIRHDGDFDGAAAAYYEDPERSKLSTIDDVVEGYRIDRVEAVDWPSPNLPGESSERLDADEQLPDA